MAIIQAEKDQRKAVKKATKLVERKKIRKGKKKGNQEHFVKKTTKLVEGKKIEKKENEGKLGTIGRCLVEFYSSKDRSLLL